MNQEEASRVRQRLMELGKEYQRVIEFLVRERGPLIRGSYGTRMRVCGTPNCRCTRGEKHEAKYLTATDGGKVRQVHVPAGEEYEVSRGVDRYRAFREKRGRLVEIGKVVLELVERLGLSLLRGYPPDDPLPPPGRLGPGRTSERDR